MHYTQFPVRDASGRLIGFGTVTRDIREQTQAQDRLRLINSELGHRLKNILSIMHTVVQQTLRDSRTSAEAALDIAGRLMAVGAATDMLTASSWNSASLRPLAERSLALHDQPGRRIRISGPEIRLHPQVGLAMALALHELGTNAIKHGALSIEAGRVDLAWRVDAPLAGGVGAGGGGADGAGADEHRFHLEWSEHGGPEVRMPAQRGFGAALIEQSLRTCCQGSAKLAWRSDGLCFVFDAALGRVGEFEPEPAAAAVEGASPDPDCRRRAAGDPGAAQDVYEGAARSTTGSSST